MTDHMGLDHLSVDIIYDKPKSGQWHCGPNAAWITVTHLPTMVQARAYAGNGDGYHRARQAAMDAVSWMLSEMRDPMIQPQFPESLNEAGQ